jgi:hypothetical protein
MTRHIINPLGAAPLLICLASLSAGCDQDSDESRVDDMEAVDSATPSYAGPEPTPVSAGDCCTTDSAPGCSDTSVEACVCAVDSYCCTTAWDGICVNEVESLGCGVCDDPAYCCSAAGGVPGCELPSVESCVCAVDSYCCTTAWDTLCANEVESLGCGSCATGWAVSIGGSGSETVKESGAVATDAAGNIYVLGTFESATIDLGGGPVTRQGYSDVFLVSYTPDGSHRWSRRIGGDDWEYAGGVGVDGSGNVYVTGQVEGSLDLGGGPLPSSGGMRDLFVGSYTSTGAYRWSQRHGAINTTVIPSDLAVNAAGQVVVVGGLDGSASLGGAVLTDAGDNDMFVLALDDSGAHLWSRALGGSGFDSAMGVAVDPNGRVAIAGAFSGSVDFGLGVVTSVGYSDGVTIRLKNDGFTDWVRPFGSTTASEFVEDVTMDANGGTYMLATFGGIVNLGDGPRTASGTREALLAGYTPSGALLWSRRVGGGSLDYGRGIALDNAGHVIATGGFAGTPADFGGAPLSGAGGYDVFLASYAVSNGAHQWSSRFGTSVREDGYDLAIAPSGAIVLVGTFASTLPVADTTLTSAGGFSDVFVASLTP